jgi:hypothetical protein
MLIYLRGFLYKNIQITEHSMITTGKGKGKVVPVLNQVPIHEDVLGKWRFRFTPPPLYPRGKSLGIHWT